MEFSFKKGGILKIVMALNVKKNVAIGYWTKKKFPFIRKYWHQMLNVGTEHEKTLSLNIVAIEC